MMNTATNHAKNNNDAKLPSVPIPPNQSLGNIPWLAHLLSATMNTARTTPIRDSPAINPAPIRTPLS